MATHYYTASSLDGFIADPDHSLSWLLSRDVDADGPMAYQQFMKSIGAVVMGSSTYRWVLDNDASASRDNEYVKEFCLGLSAAGRRSFRDIKSYKRRKRWL